MLITDEYYIYGIRILDEHKRKKYGQMAFNKLEKKLRNIGIKNTTSGCLR